MIKENWTIESKDESKPSAYLVPKICSFEGASMHPNASPQAIEQLAGEVMHSVSFLGDSHPVVDKHGIEHKPIPLYQHPDPTVAELREQLATLQKEVDVFRSRTVAGWLRGVSKFIWLPEDAKSSDTPVFVFTKGLKD